MVNTRIKVYLVLGAVFLLGALAGGGAAYGFMERSYGHFSWEERFDLGPRRLRALSRKLKLSSEQHAQVRTILERRREQRRELMDDLVVRCGDRIREHRAQLEAEIRSILTSEQQQQYDGLLKTRAERRPFSDRRGSE